MKLFVQMKANKNRKGVSSTYTAIQNCTYTEE